LDRENRALCVATFLPVFSFFPPRRSCCNNASMSGSMAPAGDVTSSGLIAGDDPLHYALLLLIVQVAIIIVLSRFITFLFSPLRQPRVVAEIIGGVLLGPTAFGRIPGFTAAIFPESSLTVLNTFANIGLIFFLFLVGLELDLQSLRKYAVFSTPFFLGFSSSITSLRFIFTTTFLFLFFSLT
jgi:hypothetical protein